MCVISLDGAGGVYEPYLPALVMIISVPMSWKRFHRSAHCSSTWISSMEAGGDGSQGPGARSADEPKEHDVLSARPSPSEPGLASESEGGIRKMRRQLWNSGIKRFKLYAGNLARPESTARFSRLTPNHLPATAGEKRLAYWLRLVMEFWVGVKSRINAA